MFDYVNKNLNDFSTEINENRIGSEYISKKISTITYYFIILNSKKRWRHLILKK